MRLRWPRYCKGSGLHRSACRRLVRSIACVKRGTRPARLRRTCPQYLFCPKMICAVRPTIRSTEPSTSARRRCVRQKLSRSPVADSATTTCQSRIDRSLSVLHERPKLGRDSFAKVPNGMPGIETRLHLMFESRRGRQALAQSLCRNPSTAPARSLDCIRAKARSRLAPDADVVVWDPSERSSCRTKTCTCASTTRRIRTRPFLARPSLRLFTR